MANIKSINGNPIVVGSSGIENGAVIESKLHSNSVASVHIKNGAVTDAKLAQSGGVLDAVSLVVTPTVARNGSSGNFNNPDAIATNTIDVTAPYYVAMVDVELLDGYEFHWVVRYDTSQENAYITETPYVAFGVDTSLFTTIRVCVFMCSKADPLTYHSLRVEDLGTDALHVMPFYMPPSFKPTRMIPTVRNGSLGNMSNANAVAMSYVQPIGDASMVKVKTSVEIGDGQEYWWGVSLYDSYGQASNNSATRLMECTSYQRGTSDEIEIVNDGSFVGFGVALSVKDSGGNYVPKRITRTRDCFTCEYVYDVDVVEYVPSLQNGTINNTSNKDCVSMPLSVSTRGAKAILFTYTGELDDGQTISWMPLTVASAGLNRDGMEGAAIRNYDGTGSAPHLLGREYLFEINDGEEAIGVALGIVADIDSPTVMVPSGLRIGESGQSCMRMRFLYGPKSRNDETITMLKNARHVPANSPTTVPALTLLHFSDIHADKNTMKKIMADFDGTLMDDAICTGDMVRPAAEQIASWWDASVMTCIGNHDSASHSPSAGYDWTALSMADRDAYYIAPFESNWGITHTSGTSYYYKDYTDSNVRLIVMDSMLYMSSSYATAATAQTSWLASLLSSAVTAGLHVLIAIHSPHGGAVAKPCSFTKLNQGTMKVNTDCDTPQIVIDTVATAIDSGLDFIGYIVGHTHQDNIWDATGDGSQLMYCVTCAAVAPVAQWENSDQSRDDTMNAYNLVTIDTNNKLVKIVRGGGADVDDKMRPRKMLCVSYDTGSIVE